MEGTFNRYRVVVVASVCRCMEINGHQTTHFVAPDTHSGIQKLYIVKDGKDVCYVGVTSQPISSRLRSGFVDAGHYGYHGYKWKDKLEQAELLVWTFPNMVRDHVEAIEAEVVYYIRKRTGNWPKYQMEIHFHQASEEQRQMARRILHQCLE